MGRKTVHPERLKAAIEHGEVPADALDILDRLAIAWNHDSSKAHVDELQWRRAMAGQPVSSPRPKSPRQDLDRPGDDLADVLYERFGHRPCGGCGSLKSQMNARGLAWCREHHGWLVERIMENAAKLHTIEGFAARLGIGRWKVRVCLEEAFARTAKRVAGAGREANE